MLVPIPEETIAIIHAYEGLGGKRNGRYYPYQGKADRKGVLTIGRGHVLSEEEIRTGKYSDGLSIEEVDELFASDIQPRARRLKELIPEHSEQEFAAALSFFYNNEYAWIEGSPGRLHRAGKKTAAAQSFLLYHKSGRPLTPRLGLWRRRGSEALLYLSGGVMVAQTDREEKMLFQQLAAFGLKTQKPKGLKE